MDYTITPAKPRSIVRRLAPWTAALGLFAGGGYGVSRYAAPAGRADATAATSAEATSSAAADRLLNSMTGDDVAAENSSRYTTPFDSPTSRYGSAPPALPPAPADDEVMTPRSAEAVEAPVNPFAAAQLAGRYASMATPDVNPTDEIATPPAATTEPAAEDQVVAEVGAPPSVPSVPVETAAPGETTDSAVADVARGQEPSGNPLRSGSRPAVTLPVGTLPVGFAEPPSAGNDAASAAPAADEARTAFGAAGASSDASTIDVSSGAAREVDPTTPAGAGLVTVRDAAPYATAPSATNDAYLAAEPAPANPADVAAPLPRAMAAPYGADAPTAARSAPGHAALSQAPSAAPTAATAIGVASPTAPAPGAYENTFTSAPAGITPTPGFETVAGAGRPGELTLEGVQSPALSVQKLAPVEIQVGKRCMFQVRVQNASQRTIHNVQVIDEVPLGTELVGTAPKATVAAGKITWELGTLSPGEERIVEMELMPTEEGEIGSVATVSFVSQASAKTRSTRPQLELRMSAAPQVMIGDKQLVQIEVTNPGTGDATGVMLLENIPEGVTHEAGPALEFEVGTLRAGETRRLDLMLTAVAAGLVDNMMTARADANLQVQANCQFEVIAPGLKLTVDGPSRRILERPATFTMSVDNPGTAAARDVQLVTQLPTGLKFVSANNHGEYDAATHSVYWSLPELPANEHGVVELTALAVEPGDHTVQVATRAQQGLEDRAETHVSVEGIVALSFEVQDLVDAIEVGGETTYEIRVVNQGTKTATNVQVVAMMPAGLRAQMVQGDARYAIEGDRVVFAPLPQLAPKSEAAFRFGVQGQGAGDQRVTLQLTTDEIRDPIVEVESTQVYADE